MTVVVGGLSSGHDALLAAALRGRGLDATPLPPPDARALATGQRLLARGHCNPTYYLSGAVVERAAAEPPERRGALAYLTAGSCGPCRFATYATEHRRALAAAGLADVRVAVIDQSSPRPTAALAEVGVSLDARLLAAMSRAIVAADVLARAGAEHRARAADPAAVDAAIVQARRGIEGALVERAAVSPHLEALGRALATLAEAPPRARVRVRITGELFASTTDGHGGLDLPRWLERRGAAVTVPAVTDWLLYLAWQARERTPRARGIEGHLASLYGRYAAAAGVREPLGDPDDLADLARPHYAPALRGGLGHLEVATFLAAERDRSHDVVVSIKPFGCMPSSALSDGVVPALARRARTVFVTIETTGDAEVQLESRLALALDAARRRISSRD